MYDDLKLTKSERETLKAVYRLTKGDESAHTGDLAERLDVSPSTVTPIRTARPRTWSWRRASRAWSSMGSFVSSVP